MKYIRLDGGPNAAKFYKAFRFFQIKKKIIFKVTKEVSQFMVCF